MNIAVSACLLGEPCRYDAKSCPNDAVIALANHHVLVPVCPEELSGLPTPRPRSERQMHGVFTCQGEDVTAFFARGAQLAWEIACTHDCQCAVLKSKSPSCGKDCIYDGSFTGTLIAGQGVTAQLFEQNGLHVYSEDELAALEDFQNA